MKTLFIIFCILIGYNAAGQQRYEYAQAHLEPAMSGKPASIVNYDFGSNKQDSLEAYRAHKLRNIIDAIELMESKGWELMNINQYGREFKVVFTTANFRRKRNKE